MFIETFKGNQPSRNKSFALLQIIVFLLPWIYGGEQRYVYPYFAVVILLLLLAALFTNTQDKNDSFDKILSIKYLLYLFALTFSVQLFQLLPLGIQIPKITTQIESTMSLLSLNSESSIITLSANETKYELSKNISYVGIMLLTMILVNSLDRTLRLIKVLFYASASVSIYTILDYAFEGNISLLDPLPPWEHYTWKTIHGTFSYRNHYAAFLAMTIPLGFGLYFYSRKKKNIKNIHFHFFSVPEFRIILFLNFLMISTLVFGASRGGNISLIGGFSLAAALYLFKEHKSLTRDRFLKLLGLASLILIFITASGVSDKLVNRYLKDGESGRDYLRHSSIHLIENNPLLGTGAGTFPISHQTFKSEALSGSGMWKRAHNDYLELLVNQGFIGSIIFGFTIALLMVMVVSVFLAEKSEFSYIHLSCIWSMSALLLHSALDYNFQLPVIAVYFYTIGGVVLSALSRRK